MKREQAVMYKFVVGFACMVVAFWSCTDEMSKAGYDLLPTGDLVSVGKVIDKNISSFTVTDVKQRTDKPAYSLLGTFNDPIFGKTTTDFACQVRMNAFPGFYKKNPTLDSLVFTLLYKEVYGDVVTAQKLKVYELESSLDKDQKYYQDINLKGLSKDVILAEKNYVPKFKLDSLTNTYGSTKANPKDTVVQELRFKLSPSLAQRILTADSTTLASNVAFLNFFKGLYIEAGDLNQGGTIMKINSLASGSGMTLYYHNANDTTKYKYKFSINDNAARVNRFAHDYSKTTFYPNLDKLNKQDELIYLQTTGGLRNKIMIPNLGSWTKLIPSMKGNRDTANLIINKAELVFQVDSTITDLTKLLPPDQLILAAIGKSKANQDSIYYPADYALSTAYFGGWYNSKDKTYRFNIAKHMQDVLEKKKGKENLGFYLETTGKNSTFRRVVLKGATTTTGIRLEVTYSKIR